MPDFSYTKITKLVVHFAGNKAREEGTEVSANVLADIGSEMNQTLASIFLEPFKKMNIINLHMKQIWILMKFVLLLRICLSRRKNFWMNPRRF